MVNVLSGSPIASSTPKTITGAANQILVRDNASGTVASRLAISAEPIASV